MLRIKAFPRIHLSLIGMNSDGYRINGGIGFSISSPTLNMCYEPSDSISITDKRRQGFALDELTRLKNHLIRVSHAEHLETGFNCLIENGIIESHVGLGSNTIIYLSCIEALLIINNRHYSQETVIELSGRGGTSGIGINTYFKGGFIFDAGIKNYGREPFSPSSLFVDSPRPKPLLMKYLPLPSWDLGICIPPIKHKTEEEETLFFKINCPISKESAEHILYEAIYGVSAALIENDFNVFCQSINALQLTKWKQLERDLYGGGLNEVEERIKTSGAKSVGMSSLGPMLYFFGDNIDGIVENVKRSIPQCACFKTSFNNSARIVEND